MPWVRLDDAFPEHGKVEGLSDSAFRLHVAALCYCARNLTDGAVTASAVRRLVPRFRRAALVELLDAGLWHESGESVFEVHDFLDYNPSAEAVKAEREAARERMRRRRGGPKTSSGSGEVRANTSEGSSGERSGELRARVRPKFGDPDPSRPDPTPTPKFSSSSNPGCGEPEEEEEGFARAVARELAVRALGLRSTTLSPIVDRGRWLDTTAHDRATRFRDVIVDLHGERPDLDVEDVADLVEPEHARARAPRFDPSCEACDGVTFVYDDDLDGMVPCPICRPDLDSVERS